MRTFKTSVYVLALAALTAPTSAFAQAEDGADFGAEDSGAFGSEVNVLRSLNLGQTRKGEGVEIVDRDVVGIHDLLGRITFRYRTG